MKKIILGILTIILLFTPSIVFGQDFKDVFGEVEPPSPVSSIPGTTGAEKLSTVINNIIRMIYVFSFIAVIFMFLIGAFQWITSGGDKEAVSKARGRITAAFVGLVVLALAFLILEVVGNVLGFKLFNLPRTSQQTINQSQSTGRNACIQGCRGNDACIANCAGSF